MREILRFVRIQWVHVLLLPVMAIIVTAAHEAAHAAAIVWQGGTVLKFTCVPSGSHWGSVIYRFPPGRLCSDSAIAMAPYALWLVVTSATVAIGLRRRTFPLWLGSTLYVWCFVVLLGDVGHAALPFLLGAENDLRCALGPPARLHAVCVGAAALAAIVGGYFLQRRMYGERSLPKSPYGIVASLCILTVAVLSIVF